MPPARRPGPAARRAARGRLVAPRAGRPWPAARREAPARVAAPRLWRAWRVAVAAWVLLVATAPASIPAEFDPAAAPEWRRLDDRARVAWHDHRAHWTGPDPPAVAAAPGRRQVVTPEWQIPLRLGDRTVLLVGDVTWVPGPSPWPWVLAAAASFAAAMAAVRGRHRHRVLAAVALLAVAADLVHTVGALLGSAAPLAEELNGSATAVAGWTVAGLAAWRLLRDRAEAAPVFLLLGGVLLTLAGALPDLASFGRSQLPSAVGPLATRAAIAVTLGLGSAMVVAALVGFRPAGRRPAARPGEPGDGPVAA